MQQPQELTFILRESPKGAYIIGDVRYTVYMHNEKNRMPEDVKSIKARTLGEAAIKFGAVHYPETTEQPPIHTISSEHVAAEDETTQQKENKVMSEHGYSNHPVVFGGFGGHGCNDGFGNNGLGLIATLALLGGRGGCGGGLFGGHGGCGDGNGAETRVLSAIQDTRREDQVRQEVHDVRARLDGVADKFDCKLGAVKDDVCHLEHRLSNKVCDVEKNILNRLCEIETRRKDEKIVEQQITIAEQKHALRDKDLFCRFENIERAQSGINQTIVNLGGAVNAALTALNIKANA